MKVMRKTSLRRGDQEMIRGRKMVHHAVCIVLAPFCAMRYVSHERYLQGYETLEGEKLRKIRKNHVAFFWTLSLPA